MLYRRGFLQVLKVDIHFAPSFKIFKIYTLLHRSKCFLFNISSFFLQTFQIFREQEVTFIRFSLNFHEHFDETLNFSEFPKFEENAVNMLSVLIDICVEFRTISRVFFEKSRRNVLFWINTHFEPPRLCLRSPQVSKKSACMARIDVRRGREASAEHVVAVRGVGGPKTGLTRI